MSDPRDISGHNPEKEARSRLPPVTELTAEQCWEHLYSARFGRIATMDGDEIEITPVNLVAEDEKIYFRTAKGTKLLHLVLNEHVAVQVGQAQGGEAWPVIVRGTARQLTGPEETARVDELPLRPWLETTKLETTKLEYVEVVPTKVTGRLFHLGHWPGGPHRGARWPARRRAPRRACSLDTWHSTGSSCTTSSPRSPTPRP